MATKPEILRPGDTIGIVTLGSPLLPEAINIGIQTLENMGFSVIVGNYVYSYSGYISTSEQQRAADLMNMFTNPNVKAIISARGGVGVEGVLQYLDYSVIAQNPKVFSGYSDITILLNVLYKWSNLITFHSLLLIDFKPGTPAYNYDQFFAATSTTISPRKLENPPGMPLISRVPGNVTGTIVGGNLASFVGSIGTPFEIDTKGKIILIEEVHEPVNTVYRYIHHMISAGKFKECAGIVMGECSHCTMAYDKTYEDLINEVMVPLNKPLMTNLATGHGIYKMAIPIGANANLNTYNNTFTILEPTVHV
ncbi:LD-carboxypeptidase [Clostridium sp. SHJSY1]|uniref:S66 peptidase family protein n=1 Tax=Clostridium sp. SHJSY1 TaxID=2942483 RepID=UPI00287627DA|nr:LD-carboxypeptidase [Clostridium sp. SHJSY1]MDS0524630.1 LD-carboxypeptidase [Clostridium sp. SHJSY1]